MSNFLNDAFESNRAPISCDDEEDKILQGVIREFLELQSEVLREGMNKKEIMSRLRKIENYVEAIQRKSE